MAVAHTTNGWRRCAVGGALLVASIMLTACTYLHYVARQRHYRHQQSTAPLQRTYKHLIDSPNYFVFGKLIGKRSVNAEALAVVAVSDRFKAGEVVDVNPLVRVDSYYGLDLPPARYQLLVLSDLDGDGYYDGSEIIASRPLSLAAAEASNRVIGDVDIALDAPVESLPAIHLHIPVPHRPQLTQSAVYPSGTIRTLQDEIFAPSLAELGLYEPAAFLERAPMMFYALEEDIAYKVPVVFVHGITGTPRDFTEMVNRLDRRLYRPWFFYYPGGMSLSQLSEFFYRIFLSGKVIPLEGMPMVIIAHSMGGLIVRDALNRYRGAEGEPRPVYLVTIASPLGGVPGAAAADSAPMAAPSWRDLAPHSAFLTHLHRNPLRGVEYDLIYTRGHPLAGGTVPDYDGVVTLASQLDTASRREATHTFGFNLNHMEVLSDVRAIAQILGRVRSVKPPFSDAQLAELTRGGFAVSHPEHYTPMERHIIESVGYFLEALANRTLPASNSAETHFVDVFQKGLKPSNEAESAWLKFRDERR